MKYTKKQCEKNIAKWQKRLEEFDKIKVGEWYKKPNTELIMYVTEIVCENTVFGYGLGLNGKWHDLSKESWGVNGFEPATREEVEKALIKEAERRGFKEGVKFKGIGDEHERERVLYTYNDCFRFDYYLDSKTFYVDCNDKNVGKYVCFNPVIFKDGKWAEIIEEPVYEYRWLEKIGNEWAITDEYYAIQPDGCEFIPESLYVTKEHKPIEETKRLRK